MVPIRKPSLLRLCQDRQVKIAGIDPQYVDLVKAVEEASANNLRSEAMSNVGKIGLTALGLGAGARGIAGLYNMIRRNNRQAIKTRSGPTTLALPYPVAPGEKRGSVLSGEKSAGWLGGSDATSVGNIPWYRPATVMAAMGGGLLGWKGIDSMIDSRRKKERQQELEDVRRDFHDALMSQYSGNVKSPGKHASDLAVALDTLYDNMEKAATVADSMGGALGMYGGYAAPVALLTGALVYDKARKRQRRAIIEKALKVRERERFRQSPPEIMAVPEPTVIGM